MGKKSNTRMDTVGPLLILLGLVGFALVSDAIKNYLDPLTQCHNNDQCSVKRPSLESFGTIRCIRNGTVVRELADPYVKETYYRFPVQSRIRHSEWLGRYRYTVEYLQPESDDHVFCEGLNLTCEARWSWTGMSSMSGLAFGWPPRSCTS